MASFIDLTAADGFKLPAYLAAPAGQPKGAVVVLQEIFGVNRVMRELGPLCEQAPEFPMATAGMAPLRAAAEALGRSEFSPLWSGQNAAGARSLSATDITRDLAQGWHTQP